MKDLGDALSSMIRPKVLIIEDDAAVGRALMEALERAGMQVRWGTTGAEGLALKSSFRPDVALVDLILPDTDGLALTTFLTRQGDCGVIIVSGLGSEPDRIVGLELGADDYISKPFHVRELLARVRAVYRRVRTNPAEKAEPLVPMLIQVGKLRIDFSKRWVYAADGSHIALTSAEFAVLETMLAASGKPVSRDALSAAALHRPWRAEDRSVDQLIFNLRHKLGEEQLIIHSIRGAGYMLSANTKIEAADPI
jgi:two-component system OmpR family response regulator